MRINKNIILLSQMLGSASMAIANSGNGQGQNQNQDSLSEHNDGYGAEVTIGAMVAICVLSACVIARCPKILSCPELRCGIRRNNRIGRVGAAQEGLEGVPPVVINLDPDEEDNVSVRSDDSPPPRYSVEDPAISIVRGPLSRDPNLVQTSFL